MVTGVIKACLTAWKSYWGNGLFLLLFAGCCLFLLVKENRGRKIRLLLGYCLVSILIFFFPLGAKLIHKVIGESVYWRLLWLLPVVPVTAYALVKMTFLAGKKWLRTGLVLLFSAAIALTGKNAFSSDQYAYSDNLQQVPGQVQMICNLIRSRCGEKDVLVAANDYLAAYIRIYDPTITMPYGRVRHGTKIKEAVWVYKMLEAWPETDYKILARKALALGVDYIVTKEPTPKGVERLNAKGYVETGQVMEYRIYERQEKGPDL